MAPFPGQGHARKRRARSYGFTRGGVSANVRFMVISTADLCDAHSDALAIAAPLFRDFGGTLAWGGRISTVKVFEDNVLVRAALDTPADGRVLVVDGGGSLRCALLGDMLAELARKNAWAGVLIYGCIRDAAAIGEMRVGVKAVATHPLKSLKKGAGDRDIAVTFAGITFTPGAYLYADVDGVIVAPRALL